MSTLFEEIDFAHTPIGPISLRRRRVLSLGCDVFEVMLGEEHLMSSLFTQGEIALARVGLAAAQGEALEVVVGGLGLGYTARAALDDPRVRSLVVIEAMEAVIDWHRRGLVPLGRGLAEDPRCRFVQADFFAAIRDAGAPRVDVILLDIDHAPDCLLNAAHADFYTVEGLGRLAQRLRPGGVFALWSDTSVEAFEAAMAAAFATSEARRVEFDNPLTGGRSGCTIYLGRTPARADG
jgi:spermidine synthase